MEARDYPSVIIQYSLGQICCHKQTEWKAAKRNGGCECREEFKVSIINIKLQESFPLLNSFI